MNKLQERRKRFPANWKQYVTDPVSKRIVELYLNDSVISLEVISKRIGISNSAVSARINNASKLCMEKKQNADS